MKNFILFLSSILLVSSCHSEYEHEHGGHDTNIVYTTTKPVRLDTFTTKKYVCQIHAIQHIELRALEKGYLQDVYVDEGQRVRKGQIMFQIMPMLYQAELKKAEAELQTEIAEAEFAQIEYQNTKSLYDSNIVSKNELALSKAKLDQANAKVNQAKAMISLADVHLKFTEIRAPFDGIMDRFQVRLGSLLDEGDLLSTLSDNSKMWVYFNVPEAEYLDYKTNITNNQTKNVSLLMANNQIFEYPGIVETIEADFNNETGNIAFRATFPNNKGLLRHGETGNVLMDVIHKNAIIIPQKATFEILEKKYVFVIDKDSIAKQIEIVIDAALPDLYVIKKGLTGDETILLDGIRKVKNNQKISYTFLPPKAVMSKLNVYVE